MTRLPPEPGTAPVRGADALGRCVVRLPGWFAAPRLAVVVPAEGAAGWADAAWWAVQLEAWGYPADHLASALEASAGRFTTLIAAAEGLADVDVDVLSRLLGAGTSLVLAGRPSEAAARLLGLRPAVGAIGGRLRIDEEDLRMGAGACVPAPGDDGCVVLAPPGRAGALGPGWTVLASWVGSQAAVAVRAVGKGGAHPGPDALPVGSMPPPAQAPPPATLAWFGIPADTLDARATEVAVLLAEATLDRAAPAGLVGLGRWPGGRAAALVVDGDVDHPTGTGPDHARYAAPALETADRAGFAGYGLFVAGAVVEGQPGSFPPGRAYYNHAYGSAGPPEGRPWTSLDPDEMAAEVLRCAEVLDRRLGRGDEGIFRPPGLATGAGERTLAELERLGYRAISSIGASHAVTGGLPYQPARRPWSDRPADAAPTRSHPDHAGRFDLLELPISSDPMAPDLASGFRSGCTLEGAVRSRTAAPEALEILLDEVLERAVARRGLAHLVIDAVDAGYGRLAGDGVGYAHAVERWLGRCVARDDLAVLTTAGLATWWRAREEALARVATRVEAGELVIALADPPPGTTLAVLEPAGAGEQRRRRRVAVDEDAGAARTPGAPPCPPGREGERP